MEWGLVVIVGRDSAERWSRSDHGVKEDKVQSRSLQDFILRWERYLLGPFAWILGLSSLSASHHGRIMSSSNDKPRVKSRLYLCVE